jgi:hypothetical protein
VASRVACNQFEQAQQTTHRKKREALTAEARAWLAGDPCGFFEFKSHDELIPLWEAHGDPDVATWDMAGIQNR